MTWRTHVMGGLASLNAILLLPARLSSTSIALACLFAILGSLLPDLDARESRLSNLHIGGITPLKPIARWVNRSLGHRGPLHSLVALLVVSLLMSLPLGLFLDPFAGIGLSLGYLSHLLLDACTRSGVPLYWPETRRTHLLPPRLRVTTGSAPEDVIVILLALIAASFFLIHLSPLDHAITPLLPTEF